MISRRPFCAAFIMSLFACSDTQDYVAPSTNATPLPNDCINPTVRNELGTQATGLKTIRIRARIAQDSLGNVAVEDEIQIVNDLLVLNTRFASSNVRFLLDDIEVLRRDESLYQLTGWDNPLCNDALKPIAKDSIPMLYVGNLVLPMGQARGMASACGAIINARTRSTEFENISGTFSNIKTVPRMIGYVLGLLQTNACYNVEGHENDPELSGDLVADTPFDPGPASMSFTCGTKTVPGTCVFIDEAACVVECSDGAKPDIHNFMSYYTGCRNRFSEGQSVYMRCAVELHHAQAKCDNVWANDFGKDWTPLAKHYTHAHSADVDGDGKADAILHDFSKKPSAWRVALSTGSQFAAESNWNAGFGDELTFSPQEMIVDVDGDNKADAVIVDKGAWHVALSKGAFFGNSTTWISNYPGLSMLADVDADGKADAVSYEENPSRFSVALSTGSAFAMPTTWIEGFGVGSRDRALGDVDGDHKADAVTFTTYKTPKLESVCKWEVARSTGNAFGTVETWYEEKCSDKHRWTLADVDGDKRLDLVVFYYESSSWFVQLSTGASFEAPQLAIAGLGQGVNLPDFADNAITFVGDVDDDNKADFVAFDHVRGIWTTNLCRTEGSSN